MPYLRRQQGTASEREGGPNAPLWISKASSLCTSSTTGRKQTPIALVGMLKPFCGALPR
jgi:hypothetical protein